MIRLNRSDKNKLPQHNCLLSFSCHTSNIINEISNLDYGLRGGRKEINNIEKIVDVDTLDDFIKKLKNDQKTKGGINKKKSRDIKENNKNNNREDSREIIKKGKNEMQINNFYDFQDLQKKILEETLKIYPNIHLDNRSHEKILNIVHVYLKTHNYMLRAGEYERLLNYIKTNLVSNFKNQISKKHPLLDLLSSPYVNELTRFLLDNEILCHTKRVALSMHLSHNILPIINLPWFYNREVYDSTNAIDPIFVLLFYSRIPGFEDLAILEDYLVMISELGRDEISKNNIFLLTLRLADPNKLPTLDPDHQTNVGNEQLRINMTILIREIATSIRQGKFMDKKSKILMNLLKSIKMNSAQTDEENLIQSIFSIYSYKPTLVSSVSGFNLGNVGVLKTVYDVEFSVLDSLSFRPNSNISLNENNLNNIIYDPETNRIKFGFENLNANRPEEMINNLYNNYMQQKIPSYDFKEFASAIMNRNDTLSNRMTGVNVYLTNGVLVVFINRSSFDNTNCINPLFFGEQYSQSINTTPVIPQETMNINDKVLTLTGALCLDVLENDINSLSMMVEEKQKIGTFAIFYSGVYWYIYRDETITPQRKQNLINRARYNSYCYNQGEDWSISMETYMNGVLETVDSERIKAQEISNEINKNNISFLDRIIPQSDALYLISKYGTLLFYTEDYELYKGRTMSNC